MQYMQGLFQTFCVRYPQAMLFFIFCSIFCSLNKDGVWGGGEMFLLLIVQILLTYANFY